MQAVIDAARASTEAEKLTPGDIISVVSPVGADHRVVDLEEYLERPRRKRRNAAMHTARALAAYVNAHKRADESTLWADLQRLTIAALLNDHVTGGAAAGWGDHRATFTARLTPEWLAWFHASGKYLGQTEFAEFLEDHAADVVSPSAADLLELAKTFEATNRCEFRGAIRLDSGQRQLTYVETIDASAGTQGQVTIPETIELGLVPFEGADRYRVNARFRYRLADGHLRLGVVLDRPDLVLQNAFSETVDAVANETEIAAYEGTPGS